MPQNSWIKSRFSCWLVEFHRTFLSLTPGASFPPLLDVLYSGISYVALLKDELCLVFGGTEAIKTSHKVTWVSQGLGRSNMSTCMADFTHLYFSLWSNLWKLVSQKVETHTSSYLHPLSARDPPLTSFLQSKSSRFPWVISRNQHLQDETRKEQFWVEYNRWNCVVIGTQIILPLKLRKSLVPECRFPPALVGWNLDQTLILKSMTADRLQSEHLSVAVFFQVRSENQSWPSRSALHTDVHSELWPSWTHGDTTEEEFDRITCTFPHQVRLHLLVGSGNVSFHEIIVKQHQKL